MLKAFGRAAALFFVLATAVPAAAQYSDSYNFLKAVRERNPTKVTELLAVPGTAVVNIKDPGSGEAALHIVVKGRDYEWLSFLLSKRATPNIQNRQGETPLSVAAQLGWTEGAELLLIRGAGVDVPNQRGETPLIFAVHRRDLAMVSLLLRGGANPNRKDNMSGYSALDYARQDGRSQAIVKLLESQAGPARPAAGPKL
ncbi:MAG: ankyrin repeat domain-containing protein [Allosphingosinicella sp.]